MAITVSYKKAGANDMTQMAIQDGLPVGEFLTDVAGYTSLDKQVISVNGTEVRSDYELEDGDLISIAAEKQISG